MMRGALTEERGSNLRLGHSPVPTASPPWHVSARLSLPSPLQTASFAEPLLKAPLLTLPPPPHLHCSILPPGQPSCGGSAEMCSLAMRRWQVSSPQPFESASLRSRPLQSFYEAAVQWVVVILLETLTPVLLVLSFGYWGKVLRGVEVVAACPIGGEHCVCLRPIAQIGAVWMAESGLGSRVWSNDLYAQLRPGHGAPFGGLCWSSGVMLREK